METATQNNELSIIHNSIEIFKTAPEILKANKERSRKAVIVGDSILQQWSEAWDIENEEERILALAAADDRSNTYLVNCGTALKQEKESRAAITQMMDEFKKMFTSAENDIDKTKAGSVADKVQGNRDNYVKEAAKIAERKRVEAENAAAKAKEEIDLRSAVEKWISDKLISLLGAKKLALTNAFNAITLENYDAKANGLKAMSCEVSTQQLQDQVGTMDIIPRSLFHDLAEKEAICNATHANYNWSGFATQWSSEIGQIKSDLIDKLPSKLAELMEQARLAEEKAAEEERQRIAEEKRRKALEESNAKERKALEEKQRKEREEEQKRLEQMRIEQEKVAEEQRQREAEEQERLKREEEEAKMKAEQEAEMKAQGDKTMALFEQEAAIADGPNAPESRQGYEIEILHPAAYIQIFQLWFDKEGKNLPVDKIGATKLDQMKAWAEKHAHKNGEMIESKFMKYEPSYKAVNRKVK